MNEKEQMRICYSQLRKIISNNFINRLKSYYIEEKYQHIYLESFELIKNDRNNLWFLIRYNTKKLSNEYKLTYIGYINENGGINVEELHEVRIK